jgi:uncharacterized protein (DUF924 family)
MEATQTTQTTPDDVLRFWIGEPGDPPLAKAASWWKKDDAFDREITERFKDTLERGVRGELADWAKTPRGRLALVILYDQFSRNMFRGTPRSFAQDPLALDIAKQALAAGDDRVVSPTETFFFLMPLMHAEDLALQKECIERFTKLRDAAPEGDVRAACDNSVKYAGLHMAIIERFGRFPHRNAILGRASTDEEVEFLKQPGSSF